MNIISEKKGKVKVQCPLGHTFSISRRILENRKENKKCHICTLEISKNYPMRDIKIITTERGFKVDGLKRYKNQNTKMRFICYLGHTHNKTWNNFKNIIDECTAPRKYIEKNRISTIDPPKQILCEKKDINVEQKNQLIDKLLTENKSNLIRTKDYPGNMYKAIEFKCILCENIVHLKWLNVERRPYCPKCKKKDFKHNLLTEELRHFVIIEYNGKLLGKFRGYKRKIKFQCKDSHIFEKSPQCIGFTPGAKEKRKWCIYC